MRRRRPLSAIALAFAAAGALALPAACTHDYGAFTVEGSAAANGEAGAGAGAGDAGASGAGDGPAGSGGDGGAAGSAGDGGAGDGGAAGSAGDGGAGGDAGDGEDGGAAGSGGTGSSLLCDEGFGDCNVDPSDGCEQRLDADAYCGSCSNSCIEQNGLVCLEGLCGCSADGQCRGAGPPAGQSCNQDSGLCVCVGTTCVPGEVCRFTSCSCNGGDACEAGETCCQTPSGCRDLDTDPDSCGACGHRCPPGSLCEDGSCVE